MQGETFVPWATTHGFRYVELRYLTEGGARIHKRSRLHFVVEESEKGNGDCAKNTSGQAALRKTDPTFLTRRDASYTRHARGFQVRERPFVFYFVYAKRSMVKKALRKTMTHI